jgi:hypothetical protein
MIGLAVNSMRSPPHKKKQYEEPVAHFVLSPLYFLSLTSSYHMRSCTSVCENNLWSHNLHRVEQSCTKMRGEKMALALCDMTMF